jgi:hypothetical protein
LAAPLHTGGHFSIRNLRKRDAVVTGTHLSWTPDLSPKKFHKASSSSSLVIGIIQKMGSLVGMNVFIVLYFIHNNKAVHFFNKQHIIWWSYIQRC